MTVTQVTCIRHGRSAWNAQGRWQGQANVGLDEVGLVQAVRVAKWLTEYASPISIVYSSDLLRARETANAISGELNVPLKFDTRLREIDMGEWQGMTGQEVELWDGARLTAVRAGGVTIKRPGGESLQEVADRAYEFFQSIVSAPDNGQHVIFVAHGGTIRMLLHGLNLLEAMHVTIDNTSRTAIVRADDHSAWQVAEFAAIDHLNGVEDTDDQPM
jgi:glucosyl-3-phosphoglycerate phosphatase